MLLPSLWIIHIGKYSFCSSLPEEWKYWPMSFGEKYYEEEIKKGKCEGNRNKDAR
jgi:hypothetical protein